MGDEPNLLRIPTTFHSAADVLATAAKLDLPNVLVLSEQADGSLVFLSTEMTLAETNWLLDRMKTLMLEPGTFARLGL